ncbi:MAG: hypothetical protein JW951_02645 [Lentisphaerae bacterium]|nr:hypothetical protein [Lentisphaerota bacterium]
MTRASFLKTFRNPGSACRGAPLWAWNGALEPDALRRQVRLMHRMGLGGFFMHSRVGLDTPYLSDAWFACINACIDEADRLGMRAWLYDEDRWPSGAAGGLVTREPRYRMRHLEMAVLRRPAKLTWSGDVLAVFTARVRGDTVAGVERLPRGRRPGRLGRGRSLLVFRHVVQPCSSWFNGRAYLDTLNPKAVRAFIRVTHEAYRRRCGEHFGGRVPGIFTDEPNVRYGGAPAWTDALPAVFRRRYGYDLLDHLPELFFDIEGREVSRARYHYFDCVTHLFVSAFARQIGAWCERHGLLHTGHVLYEDSLSLQSRWVGSAMRFYEHMQAPGMDLLTERWRVYDTAKQVASAARQFGRTWRLSETYGCTGWDFPLRGHKALGDWQAALGINLRCQHLAWYTMLGEAKRDYPAGIFYQSPWWPLYGKVEDYFARIFAVMTRGTEVRDVLVVHPLESVWALLRERCPGEARVRALDAMLPALRDTLLDASLDFDYGDEEIMSRHGRVSGRDGAVRLHVGQAAYRVAVVPPLRTIRGSTVRLLDRFRRRGGTVIFAGNAPDHVDARPSRAAAALAERCLNAPAKGAALARAVAPRGRRLSIRDGRGREIAPALYLLREDRGAAYLFVVNTGVTRAQRRRLDVNEDVPVAARRAAFPEVRIRGLEGFDGRPVELDPDSGEAFAASARRRGAGWEIRTDLPALGSRLFMIPRRQARPPARRKTLRPVRTRALRKTAWPVTRSEPNVLVLDRPRYRIDGGRWHAETEILKVDFAVRDALGVPRRGGRMVQPWARQAPRAPKRATVELRYTFRADALPDGEVFLGIERPATYTMALNGRTVSADTASGWWCDRSLERVPVEPALLRRGTNTIELTCRYDETHPGLEIVYLLGAFGVRVQGAAARLTPVPKTLRIGNWVTQGLPFYSGSVAYHASLRPALKRGERLFLTVPRYAGTAVRVSVNAEPAGIIAWEPNEVELTPWAGRGSLRLRIEVMGHRRNSHGPLHLADPHPAWTGPAQFVTEGAAWSDAYRLVPCGLLAAPRLDVRR